MEKVWTLLLVLVGVASTSDNAVKVDPIDYEQIVHLDAEDLAEGGMVEAYERITAAIADERLEWAPMTQSGEGTPDYSIHLLGESHRVYGYSPGTDDWAISSAVLFHAVNRQLVDLDFKVYALMGGNDLHAVALTERQFEEALRYHKRRYNRPYLPNQEPPHFGYPE